MQAELTDDPALAVEAKPEGICPGCAVEMEKKTGVVWGTLLLIAILPPLGFLAFIITGLVERRAVCPSCGHSEHLYKIF
jgi:hypothetical protein